MTQTAESNRFPTSGETAQPLRWPVATPQHAAILTPEAQTFVEALCQQFTHRRNMLLAAREERQIHYDKGLLPDWLPETRTVRDAAWQVTAIPADLQDRRVEITGPVERKMVINALNSGAKCFMADFEDSHAPTWHATMDGQVNLRDAVRGTIEYTAETGKHYTLDEHPAVLIVRPRGWHLPEKHVTTQDGQPIPAALLDFALYLFHNAYVLLEKGSGPYFYLPKLEHWQEAELWADVFAFAEDYLNLPHQTIKATVLVETITATFQLHEILHALKDYCVALNCGRWDYIFSYIKKLRHHPDRILPERAQVTMTVPFMRAYSRLVIETCHARGAMAMGGMAAQIPIKDHPEANEAALEKVRLDKEREVLDGHDGTWVAHPGLVPVAMRVFNQHMPEPNQLNRPPRHWHVTAEELLAVPNGTITEAGVRNNITVALRYIASWLGGNGCVPIFHLMEDAATAEISRAQLWQWLKHGATLAHGHPLTQDLYLQWQAEEVDKLQQELGTQAFEHQHFPKAVELLQSLVLAPELQDFLTLPAYATYA